MPLPLAQYLQSKYFDQEQQSHQNDQSDLVQIHVPRKPIHSASAADQHIDSLGRVSADLQKRLLTVVILDLSNTGITQFVI